MTKQKLKFKVEGGLNRLSDFYAATDTDLTATDTYWHNPAALMEALEVAPAREIRISTGYKKLAETMDKVDFGKWHGTFDRTTEDCEANFQDKAFNSLMHAVGGSDTPLHAGTYGEKFNQAFTVTSVAVVVVVVTVTVVSGYQAPASPEPPFPADPSFRRWPSMRNQSPSRWAGFHEQDWINGHRATPERKELLLVRRDARN